MSTAPKLEQTESRKDFALWVAPSFRPYNHSTVFVDPVIWEAPPRSAAVEAKLKEQFRRALIEQLQKQYHVSDLTEAGSSALRVRAAITNVRRTRWYLNAPVQVATFALGGIGLFAPLQGSASEEIQVENARTGEVVLQLATFRNGKPWNMKGAYVAYDHANMAFANASRRLAKALHPPMDN